MPLMVGVLLAVAVGLMATSVGLDLDRAFYPTVTIVIAFLYALFAIMGESTQTLALELLVGSVFLALAVGGFRSSLWMVVIALAAHGFLDLVHPRIITNPGVPAWWPAFCGAYDVAAAVYLASMLKVGRIRAAASAN